MENLPISKIVDSVVYFEGFPDCIKIIQLDGDKADRLSHLSLHKLDIDFADYCLDNLKYTEINGFIKEALFRLSIITFMKCFKHSKSGSGK